MQKHITEIFKQYKDIQAPTDLSVRICARIAIAQEKAERAQRRIWGAFSILSLSAFFASGWYAFQTVSASNFGSYFSLIFSDLGSIGHVWRELGLSLLESLPIVGIGVFLASVCALLWSMRTFAKHAGRPLITTTSRTRAA